MESIIVRVFLLLVLSVTLILTEYWEDRANLLNDDHSQAIGAFLMLTPKEQKVNEILMGYKLKEYDDGFVNPGRFLAAQHFFHSKKEIENSEVFKLIKQIPKGASLHSHDTAMVSQEYLYNLTYEENLYGCMNDGLFILHFFDKNNVSSDCKWELLSALRSSDSTIHDIIKSSLTLIVDYPEYTYPDLNSVWDAFINIFVTINDLISYKPVKQEHFYQVLKELYEDKVMYLEFRSTLSELYDLEGNNYDVIQFVGLLYDTLQLFKNDYPDFHGARIIYAPDRKVSNQTFDNYVTIFLKLKELYPDFVTGFDLVGQEDLGL